MLWHRPAPVALIEPLAWESPYDTGVALKSKKKKRKRKKETRVQARGNVISLKIIVKTRI